jgi:hypothetical protein
MASATIRNVKGDQIKIGCSEHMDTVRQMVAYVKLMEGEIKSYVPYIQKYMLVYACGTLTDTVEMLMENMNGRLPTDVFCDVLRITARATPEYALPAGWEVRVSSQNGQIYYANTIAKTTQWERPSIAPVDSKASVTKLVKELPTEVEGEDLKTMYNRLGRDIVVMVGKRRVTGVELMDGTYARLTSPPQVCQLLNVIEAFQAQLPVDGKKEKVIEKKGPMLESKAPVMIPDRSVRAEKEKIPFIREHVVIPVDLREKCWMKHFGENFRGKCPCEREITLIGERKYYVRSLISQVNGTKKLLQDLVPVCHRCSAGMGTMGAREYFRVHYNLAL